MENPVLVEVLRGDIVESRHRGAVAVIDAEGSVVAALGDIERPVLPRSAVKAIQALPLVESGAADAFGFGDKELALACASHSGEPEHATLAAAMLARAGLGGEALECGSHWPLGETATLELARAGKTPTPLHNNCSGKHAGFICACCHMELDHRGYVEAAHPYQMMIRDAMEVVTGAPHGAENHAIDGCSIPTYSVPLRALAQGFARMATGHGFGPVRASAAHRLFGACMAEPFYVAGSDRADTKIMQAGGGRVFVKTGAEGVYCAALPALGLGIALKCDDGATRASEVMVAKVLADLIRRSQPDLSSRLDGLTHAAVVSRKGVNVGSIRVTKSLAVPGAG
ncbi:asparaginase [Mesorhizobium xinjiangense]|uniref:asparaginase n=1 Tax=Mesorhizobium xinjiangense TaxID=2678685 RepID=UPI0012EEB93F|nr:asparaginase [Mesorhizobium xinjiangense]